MIQYDPEVIQAVAARLYSRANSIIMLWTLLGLLGGFLLGNWLMHDQNGAMIGACIAGLLGYSIGYEKALHLKFEAQIALCQVKIEEHNGLLVAALRSGQEFCRIPGKVTQSASTRSSRPVPEPRAASAEQQQRSQTTVSSTHQKDTQTSDGSLTYLCNGCGKGFTSKTEVNTCFYCGASGAYGPVLKTRKATATPVVNEHSGAETEAS